MLFVGGVLIFVMVVALARGRVRAARRLVGQPRWCRRFGIVFPVAVLFGLLVYSLWRAGALTAAGPPAVRIEVTGEQWWWRVAYLSAEGNIDFVTANEIRIPVGPPSNCGCARPMCCTASGCQPGR